MWEIGDVARELEALDAAWAARRPQLVAAKQERMRAGSFPFLRASAPLFFARLRQELAPPRPPEVEPLARWLEGDASAASGRIAWCAGDVHVENFGAYRADDGDERFGLNDFDDALVAPVEVDTIRLAASVLVAARAAGGLPGPRATQLARTLLETYAREVTLAAPDPGRGEVPGGPVRSLIESASDRSRAQFIEHRAPVSKKGKRRFVASERYRPLEDPERARVIEAFERAVASLPDEARERKLAGFYTVVDVAARTAGLGSLGCGRYAILVEGKGGESGGVLLELKEAKPASLARHPGPPLRAFEDDAARVVAGQIALRASQAPHLGRTTLEGVPYYLRRLSHREERVDLVALGASAEVLEPVVGAEARALARAHARSRRALGAGALEPAGEREREAWLALACRLAASVEGDYLAFCGVSRPARA